uniref:Uncharacterized protein n=1 Tax=Anguilla anguilla TaxID=7936 RepID=A0A0E9REN8_ANGAN
MEIHSAGFIHHYKHNYQFLYCASIFSHSSQVELPSLLPP